MIARALLCVALGAGTAAATSEPMRPVSPLTSLLGLDEDQARELAEVTNELERAVFPLTLEAVSLAWDLTQVEQDSPEAARLRGEIRNRVQGANDATAEHRQRYRNILRGDQLEVLEELEKAARYAPALREALDRGLIQSDRYESTLQIRPFARILSAIATLPPEPGDGADPGNPGNPAPEEDDYEVHPNWTVASGRVQFLFFSAGNCVSFNGSTLNGVTYFVHSSKWQRRSGPSDPWTDIEGTEKESELCSYTPTEAGEYRAVGEFTIGGERQKLASNTLAHP